MEGLRNVCIDLSNFGLNFFGPRMGLIESQSVQGGKGLTLVPPGHPKAVFEAVFEVDFGGDFEDTKRKGIKPAQTCSPLKG